MLQRPSYCFLCSPWRRSALTASSWEVSNQQPTHGRRSSFADLVALSSTAYPGGELLVRLNRLLTTPVVDNGASDANTRPHRPGVKNVGPVLRVGLWNIERGLNFQVIRSALTDTLEFESLTDNLGDVSSSRRECIESQLVMLQDVDVLVLNEVDLGMKRTEYWDIARELAAALHMNYTYGVEFVEVDPVFELGTEAVHLPPLVSKRLGETSFQELAQLRCRFELWNRFQILEG